MTRATVIDLPDEFDTWAVGYDSFYVQGSRGDLEFRLARKIVMAGRRWTNVIDGLIRAKTGQTRGRWQTLFAIAFSEPPLTTSALAERMDVQWPTLVRVLEGLERDGLITRTENPADKRSRFIAVTPSGDRLIREIKPMLDTARAQAFAGLDNDELELCSTLLTRLLDRTKRWRDLEGD
ncbi:MAG: MarR family winged helix-turn-helix transcriptional regulator [Sphingomonadales bacterium]